MRTCLRFVVAFSLFSIGASPAFAQRRVPDTGMWAIGGSVGASAPSDASLGNGFNLAGNLEGYLTPRVSIRGQLGSMWSDITGRNFTGTINPVFFDGNVTYNWEGGAIHPFVTGGVGIYHYRSSINGAPAGSDTRPGVDVGGGVELFYHRRATVTVEGLFHAVSQFDTPVTTFNQGQFWTFGVGLKHYF
jgi:hypothetical protein